MSFRPTIFVFLFFAFMASACTSAKYLNMVPTGTMNHAPTHKILSLGAIKTHIKTGRSTPLEMETYQQALVAAMEKTRMFKSVQTTPAAKGYRLETTVTHQKLRFKDDAAHFDFSTRYRFVNRFNQVIYSTDINSRCVKTTDDHSVLIKRQRRAIECGVQKNLSTLVDKLYIAQHNFR